ncbi:MAG: dioxygenase [Steroidobacteraceae bacterium]
MVIQDEFQLTQAVLAEAERTPDPRLKQILTALIRHLHGFAREVRLTEREFDQAINLVTALGHHTTESHNETRLIAGSLGLRGRLTADENGDFWYRSIKPSGYPVPAGGPTEILLDVQHRHPFRPAHLHALIYKDGFKTNAVGHYVLHENEPAADPDVKGPWYSLEHTFTLQRGKSWRPTPPVSAKSKVAAKSMAGAA